MLKQNCKNFHLKKFKKLPTYKLISNTGPRHKPLFKVGVKLIDTKFYIAEGKSKKDAEQNAAILCLTKYKKYMIWDDIGFLLAKNRYNENSLISDSLYRKSWKSFGYNFWRFTSKKIKNYLQVGNKVHINFNSKSENKIGYFKIEIQQALSPFYFDNPQKLSCIISAMQFSKIVNC